MYQLLSRMKFHSEYLVKVIVAAGCCFLIITISQLHYIIQYIGGKKYGIRDIVTSLVGSGITSEMTCPIRDIIKTLHGPNTSAEIANAAIHQLRYCKTIYFTSVPKCATRTIFQLFKPLQSKNHFRAVNWVNCRGCNVPPKSKEFLGKITYYPGSSIHRRAVGYVNFTRYGFPSPVYISVIRHPVDRLVSHYYFEIFSSGKNTRTSLTEVCSNITLDEAVSLLHGRKVSRHHTMMSG